MNDSKIVFLINDHVSAFRGEYEPGGVKDEIFKTMDHTIKVDDLVAVESSTRHKITTVKVTEINVDVDFDSDAPIKWAVQKITTAAFTDMVKQEAEAISAFRVADLKRKKAALRADMMKDHEGTIDALSLSDFSAEEDVTEYVSPPASPDVA